jgi:hypothetical protein
LDKISAIARALAVLLAILAAFVNLPMAFAILFVLGAIAAVTNTPENNLRIWVITIVLMLTAKSLDGLPAVGTYLSAIFTNLGVGLTGASLMGITLGMFNRIRGDWASPQAAAASPHPAE